MVISDSLWPLNISICYHTAVAAVAAMQYRSQVITVDSSYRMVISVSTENSKCLYCFIIIQKGQKSVHFESPAVYFMTIVIGENIYIDIVTFLLSHFAHFEGPTL